MNAELLSFSRVKAGHKNRDELIRFGHDSALIPLTPALSRKGRGGFRMESFLQRKMTAEHPD
jgi:hypothetical protein